MNGKIRLMMPGILLGTLTAASAIAATNLDGLRAGVAAPPMVLAQRGEGRPDKREDKEAGRQSMEVQSEERRREMEEEASGAAERTREERERRREQSQGEEPKGLEQQRERKMEQEQKELGKGSEQGQESREQRKKWWRFWE